VRLPLASVFHDTLACLRVTTRENPGKDRTPQ